jgi:hypothetical protein
MMAAGHHSIIPAQAGIPALLSHPFGLSLSKPCSSPQDKERPFDKLRANGGGEQ